MLKPVVELGAEMNASDVLERLAANGFWLDPNDRAARARIARVCDALAGAEARSWRDLDGRMHAIDASFAGIARALARKASDYGAAIRRQWGANVLWYSRELADVLSRCAVAPPDSTLLDVMNLHESDSAPPIDLDAHAGPLYDGVALQSGRAVAAVLGAGAPAAAPRPAAAAPVPVYREYADAVPRGAGSPATRGGTAAMPAATTAQVWPRFDAPSSKAAGAEFDVVVGFGAGKQQGVAGAQVTLPFRPDRPDLDVTVELTAGDGVGAIDGWTRTLRVNARDPFASSATFRLVGTEPPDADHPWLTTLEIRYVLDGTICGTASRPIVILPAGSGDEPPQRPFGMPWTSIAASASPVVLAADPEAPDLTIEITNPDGDTSGRYQCRLFSRHALATPSGPFRIALGNDAKSFARAMVDDLRMYAGVALVEAALKSHGLLIAKKLPPEAFAAIGEIAAKIAPDVPTILIVSAEPYVPWELAWMPAPIDATRPSYLGAQAIVGRWLRDNAQAQSNDATTAKPPTHPIASIDVENVAIMAALYKAQSALRRLPKAEAEAKSLAKSYPSVLLPATSRDLLDLLYARLHRDIESIEAQAMHFAGHGDFDPTQPDGAVMFLEDGSPVRSMLFRSAAYGDRKQPLLFLNACMLGIGGEVLGDMGGFPGNSLSGGFGGVLGALWEVDDTVAHDIALDFWSRALPEKPGRGEPIGSILRDIRRKYKDSPEVSTYLAYVYYGHPRLTLARV